MPKTLLDRCLPDSIWEFRESARQRFDDGLIAAASDRRTAAIYLWGYVAEMTLKAAYFDALGFTPDQEITMGDLNDAVSFGTSSMVLWPRRGRLHSVRAWAETLVVRRGSSPVPAYDRPDFGSEVARKGQRIERYWNESLRYHKNVAYLHEVKRVKESAEWLLTNTYLL
jgi:hypothetical protein